MNSFYKSIDELRKHEAIEKMQKLRDEMKQNKVKIIDDLNEANRALRSEFMEIYEKNFRHDFNN